MLSYFLLAATAVANVGAVPYKRADQECTNPQKRIEWRELGSTDQQGYIDAVLCLKTKPSRRGLDTPLYDDFPHVHFELADYVHHYASFLPWHRYFTHVYEQALRECGYTGPMTYWDWTLDVQKLAQSPVMASTLGFGGDGSDQRTETLPDGETLRCVDSGPFSDLRPAYRAISPTEILQKDHCLHRGLIDGDDPNAVIMAESYNATSVETVSQLANFTSFAPRLEGSPHGAIHASLGGEMNPTTSPNVPEPLFFLHHAQVDRIWWLWQQQNPEVRELDYAGARRTPESVSGVPATSNDTLQMLGLAEDIPVKDVLNTYNSKLCYTY
ncbi:Di-copper centre-containing protein [Corynespora cassiicola Philippines]|uniref:Di-copper centre-containing protein n=1 Tax=Corynespora cassiicola Philippines TaxID=1448308 RepID=A0A2T2N8C4_CORCC|nr:Di-copper centre-containing protein [Corynespora cassiicola Philippines]